MNKNLRQLTKSYSTEIHDLLKLAGRDVDTEWLLGAESSVDFLKKNALANRIVLYASLPHVFIHAVLAPKKQITNPDQTELGRGFIQPDSSWTIEHSSGGGKPDRVYLAPPLRNEASMLNGGEKLIFRRWWAGAERTQPEISQKLIHALDLHYVEERNAYCHIDDQGDVEDVVNIFDIPAAEFGESILVVTIAALEFYEFAFLAGMGVYFSLTSLAINPVHFMAGTIKSDLRVVSHIFSTKAAFKLGLEAM